jgi:hypothetical protein
MSIKEILMPSFMMIAEMDKEREKCRELISREPESVEIRRMVIRSLFSIIEGTCYRMKLSALLIGRLNEIEFSQKEREMIEEKILSFDKKGKAQTKCFYPNIERNLKFAFKILIRILKSDFKLDLGNSDFREFQEAVKIRNQLTHPKGIKHLDVYQDDFNKVIRSYDWFISNVRELYNPYLKKLVNN